MNEDNRYAPPRAPVSDSAITEGEEELAGRGVRLGAAIIDGVILGLVIWPYAMTTDYWTRAMQGQVEMSDLLSLSLVSLIGFLVLHGYLLHTSGQTIGKRLLGIRIVSATDGQIISLGRVFGLRYVPIQIASVLPAIGNILPLLDVLFIFREDRRCLHDLIAGTKVVKVGQSGHRADWPAG
jgi:uncharacterized RDD family membrane protein YckC